MDSKGQEITYLSIRQAAQYLAGVSERALRNRIWSGEIKAFRFGRRVLVRREDLDNYLLKQNSERRGGGEEQ
jgi:excisionase family DNA binding protein